MSELKGSILFETIKKWVERSRIDQTEGECEVWFYLLTDGVTMKLPDCEVFSSYQVGFPTRWEYIRGIYLR